jgi:hypothetical protein
VIWRVVVVVAGEFVDGRDTLPDVDQRLGRGLVAVAVAVLDEQVDRRFAGDQVLALQRRQCGLGGRTFGSWP